MPTISMFYEAKHKKPHIHARYQGEKAVFSVPDGRIIAGRIGESQSKLVRAWIEIHQAELLADWELAKEQEPLIRIRPLE